MQPKYLEFFGAPFSLISGFLPTMPQFSVHSFPDTFHKTRAEIPDWKLCLGLGAIQLSLKKNHLIFVTFICYLERRYIK